MANDFEVVRGTAVIAAAATSVTLTEGTDYDMPASYASNGYFSRIINNFKGGSGHTADGSNSQDGRDFMVWISAVSGSGITFSRYGTNGDCRVDFEIVCYIGSPGGDNEIIVHAIDTLELTGTTSSNTGTAIAAITDNADVVPFLTGQGVDQDHRRINDGFFRLDMVAKAAVIDRNADPEQAGQCSYAIVEFKGANWSVHRQAYDQTNAAHTFASSYTIPDLTKAFWVGSFKYDRDTGDGIFEPWTEEICYQQYISSTTQITGNAASTWETNRRPHITYIVANAATGTEAMVVTRVTAHSFSGTGTENVEDVTITTLADLSNASVMGLSARQPGGNNNHPRGFIGGRLTSTTTLRLVNAHIDDTATVAWEAVSWPQSDTAKVLTGGINAGPTLNGSIAKTGFLTGGLTATPLLAGHLGGEAGFEDEGQRIIRRPVIRLLKDKVKGVMEE